MVEKSAITLRNYFTSFLTIDQLKREYPGYLNRRFRPKPSKFKVPQGRYKHPSYEDRIAQEKRLTDIRTIKKVQDDQEWRIKMLAKR
jgi:hypothetical protein